MDIRHAWQFAAVQALLPLLSGTHSVPLVKPDALEDAVTTADHPLLAQIHAKLLRLPPSSQQKWRGSILRYMANHPHYFADHLPQLASDEDYDAIAPHDKLVLLHALAEAVLSEHPPDATVEQLRLFPVGYDALNNQYWYFGDAQRVYREPGESEREKREREAWAEAKAEEQREREAEKEERRREREEKRVQIDKKKEERRRKDAQKWAPRVAVGRSTRASRRLQEKADMKQDADEPDSMSDVHEPTDDVELEKDAAEEKSDAVMDDWLLREIGITSDDDDDDEGDCKSPAREKTGRKEEEKHASRRSRRKPRAKEEAAPKEEEDHAPRRSGRRRKPTQQPVSRPAKRPRKKDPSPEPPPPDPPSPPPPPPPKRKEFADPTLRECTQWETLTTDAAELRAFLERFGERDKLAPVERSLLKRLDQILPEMDEAEARAKREADRKAKAEFLMLNQKRSTRVRAIRSRREEEARLEAEREEKAREEAMRLAAHQRAVHDAVLFLVRDQSRDIRGARREFGMDLAIDRDEGAVRKQEKEKAIRAAATVPIRRSTRTHRAKRQFGDDGEHKAGAETTAETPETTVEAIPETTPEVVSDTAIETGLGSGEEVEVQDKPADTSSQPDKVLNIENQRTLEESESFDGVNPEHGKDVEGRDVTITVEPENGEADAPHTGQKGEFKDLEDLGTMIDSAEGTSKSSPGAEAHTDLQPKQQRFSSASAEKDISPSFTWSTNDEDKLPMRVLDKFFFASHSNFSDAPLEDCEAPESNMVGFGLLIPPTTSEPYVERVELSELSEWMFEYGGSPKIWIRTPHGWYELREPAVEYQKTFSTARRKFEICARVAIMGDTMRGPQLNYSSILDYLSYPYGEMLAYTEDDVLTEKRYIVPQMELLNKRSLLQSGFIKELQKRIRGEDKKATMARAKAVTRDATREAALVMKQDEQLAGVKEEDIVLVTPFPKKEEPMQNVLTLNEVKAVQVLVKDVEKKVREKKRPPRKRSTRPVPRAVSSIVNGLLRAATKSYKTPRKRKVKPAEGGSPAMKQEQPLQPHEAAQPKRGEGTSGTGTGARTGGGDAMTKKEKGNAVPNGTAAEGLSVLPNGGHSTAEVKKTSPTKHGSPVKSARRNVRKEPVSMVPRLVGHGMSPFVGSPRPVVVGKARFGYVNGVRREGDVEKE